MFLPSEVAFPYFVYSAIVTDRVMAYKNKNHNNSYVYTEFRQKPLFTLTHSAVKQPDPKNGFQKSAPYKKLCVQTRYIRPHGLFRQNLNGTGTGTIEFIEYYARNSHCSRTGIGTGTGNLTNGFQTHLFQLTRSPYGTL